MSDISTHHLLGNRTKYDISPFLQSFNLNFCYWVFPHGDIHSRTENSNFILLEVPGSGNECEKVITYPIGQLGQSVGTEWSHQKVITPFPQLDVQDRVTSPFPQTVLILVREGDGLILLDRKLLLLEEIDRLNTNFSTLFVKIILTFMNYSNCSTSWISFIVATEPVAPIKMFGFLGSHSPKKDLVFYIKIIISMDNNHIECKTISNFINCE